MIHQNLINPKSIVVVGGSDNIQSPGGRVLKNLIDHRYKGKLYVVNPKKDIVQGIISFQDISKLPETDLAIIAIAAKFIPETVRILTEQKNTKGFIIFSAGFSEKDAEGAALENKIVELIDKAGGTLLGPNNIGLINQNYTGVFTTPIPRLDPEGVDFISGSGATAVFIIEAAQSFGLTFSSVYTVGNSAQTGVEEMIEYLDKSFNENSSKVKLLYIESIKNPTKFLKHTRSLIRKGCRIAAIKAGSSEAGNRAASSHTGAMASPDVFVEALFKKAGIIRCYGRNELINVAGILQTKESKGKNIAIITHAGGPAVMLTDILSKNGLSVPAIRGKAAHKLLEQLYNGSSVANPIDFLATGTAEQLETIIDYCENKFNEIDAMVVIFGSPGLTRVYDVYNILDQKIKTCKKPIYPVLPSVINVKDEIDDFTSKGNIAFADEVNFGKALCKVFNLQIPAINDGDIKITKIKEIRNIIENSNEGYLDPEKAKQLIKLCGIPFADQWIVQSKDELQELSKEINYPVVQKIVGPLHKSDSGGVILNVSNKKEMMHNFDRLMQISNAEAVLIQPMLQGIELFAGAKKEAGFPHIILAGLGGIFVEVLKDVQNSMIPVSKDEAMQMIMKLKGLPLLKGIRGQHGIDLKDFAEIINRLSDLLQIAPEISELDINPLLGTEDFITAVDVRIRIDK